MKPKVGAAAKARNTTPKPLKGKRIYVDVPNSFSRTVLRTLVQDFTLLGASIEEFFTQDVKYLVTACIPPDACRSGKAAVSYPSSASPFSCATAATDSPSPAESQRSPLPGSNDGSRTSRGRAILAKANQAGVKGNLIDLARQWRINVVHVDDAQRWIEKEKLKLTACGKSTDGSTKQETTPQAQRTTAKQKALIPPFVKLEDSSRPYRPVYQVLESWPTLNFSASDGGCPFNNSAAAPKERGKAKKRGRIAETSLKASCDRDTFVPNPDKPSGDTSQIHLKKGSRRCAKEMQEVTVCEKQKQDAESKKPGYCECCKVKYFDVTEHLRSDQHRAFAANAANYTALDLLIAGGPNMERFLEDVLKYHNVHVAEGLDPSHRPGDCDSARKGASSDLEVCTGGFAHPLPVSRSSKACDVRDRRCRQRADVKSPASKGRLKSSATVKERDATAFTDVVLSCDVPAATTTNCTAVASLPVNTSLQEALSNPVEENGVDFQFCQSHHSVSYRSAEKEPSLATAIESCVAACVPIHSPIPPNHVEEICYSTVEVVRCISRENTDDLYLHNGADQCNAKPLPCNKRHFDRSRVSTVNAGLGVEGSTYGESDDLPTAPEPKRKKCTKSPGRKKCEGTDQLIPVHRKVVSRRRNVWHRSFSEGDIPCALDRDNLERPLDVPYENVSERDIIFDDPDYRSVFSDQKKEFDDVHEKVESVDRSVKNLRGFSCSHLDDCEACFHHHLDALKQKENHMLLAPSLKKRNRRLSVSRRYRPYGDGLVKRPLVCRRRIQSDSDSRTCFIVNRSVRIERATNERGAACVPAIPATASDAAFDGAKEFRISHPVLCSDTNHNAHNTPEVLAGTTIRQPFNVSFSGEAHDVGNLCHRQRSPMRPSAIANGDLQQDYPAASSVLVHSVFKDPSTYGGVPSALPNPETGSATRVPCTSNDRALVLVTSLTHQAGTGTASNVADRGSPHRSPHNEHAICAGVDGLPHPGTCGTPIPEAVNCHSLSSTADTPATREEPDLEGSDACDAVQTLRHMQTPISLGTCTSPAFSNECCSSEATFPAKVPPRSPNRLKLPRTVRPSDETAAVCSRAAAIGVCFTTSSISKEVHSSTESESAMPTCSVAALFRVPFLSGVQSFANAATASSALTCNSASSFDKDSVSRESHVTIACKEKPASDVRSHRSLCLGNTGGCAPGDVQPSAVARSPQRSSLAVEVNAALQQKLGHHVPFGATSCSPKGKLFRSSSRVPKHFDLGAIVSCFDKKKGPPSFSRNSAAKRQQLSVKNPESKFEGPSSCGDVRDPSLNPQVCVSMSNCSPTQNGTAHALRPPAGLCGASCFPQSIADPTCDASDFQLSTSPPVRPMRRASSGIEPCSLDKWDSGLSCRREASKLRTPSKNQTAGFCDSLIESSSGPPLHNAQSHCATPSIGAYETDRSYVAKDGRSLSLEQLAVRMNDVSPSIRRVLSSPRSTILMDGVVQSSDDDFEPTLPRGSRLSRNSTGLAHEDLFVPGSLPSDEPSDTSVSFSHWPSSLDVSFSRNPSGAKRYLYTKISRTSSLKSNVRTSALPGSSSCNNGGSPCLKSKLVLGNAGPSSVRPGVAGIATCDNDHCADQGRTTAKPSISTKLKGMNCAYVDDKNDPYFPDF